MIKLERVRELERLISRLEAAHEEISKLAQGTPDGEMSDFKRRLVSGLLDEAALFLGKLSPSADRSWFQKTNATYSDAVLTLSQYIRAAASVRVDNSIYRNEKWYWELESTQPGVPETPYLPLGRPKVD